VPSPDPCFYIFANDEIRWTRSFGPTDSTTKSGVSDTASDVTGEEIANVNEGIRTCREEILRGVGEQTCCASTEDCIYYDRALHLADVDCERD
jgi:hypothetical protein